MPGEPERQQRPGEIAEHNCLRYAHSPHGDEWRFLAEDGEPVSVRVRGNLVTHSGDTPRGVAIAGGGIVFAPRFLVGEDLARGDLVRILPSYAGTELAVFAVYPHRRHLSAKVRRFLDLATRHFAERQDWTGPSTRTETP